MAHRSALTILLFCLTVAALFAQEWRAWGGGPGGQKYSKLTQINRKNVKNLQIAWTYHTGEISDGTSNITRSTFETTPLFVDGVLYLTTPFNRLVALDPETGKELWSFNPKLDLQKPHNLWISRGASYWTDGKQKRIVYGAQNGRMYSIDPATHEPDPAFGDGGSIDMRKDVTTGDPRERVEITSPPAIYRNLIISGHLTSDGEPKGPSGDVRAFDIRTGKQVWRFHVIPKPGELGHDTWEGDSWKDRAAANAWSVLSVDTERGIVFLPLTSAATDMWGGDRKGDNLFSDSLVALDASTGKRLWHFQTIHHDLWDWDLPSQPMLVEVERQGQKVPAVIQITKTGLVYIFHRVTGEPLFPIEERPVPQTEIPGEATAATQPFPVKPAPLTRHTMRPDEIQNAVPETRKYCEELLKDAVFAKQLYTPFGFKPAVMFPSTNGGANWGGGAWDPETNTLYVNTMEIGMLMKMVKRPEGSIIPYRPQGLGTPNSRLWDKNLIPCQQPPWGYLTAVDMNSGEFRWRSVLGVVDELMEKGLPPTGTSNLGGPLVTAGGLVFIAATNDRRFRAFDKDTGKELWTVKLPASGHANPMTYQGPKSKKQYVVIAAGGGNKYNSDYSDALIAYALPD